VITGDPLVKLKMLLGEGMARRIRLDNWPYLHAPLRHLLSRRDLCWRIHGQYEGCNRALAELDSDEAADR
jgi:hypothetical protein